MRTYTKNSDRPRLNATAYKIEAFIAEANTAVTTRDLINHFGYSKQYIGELVNALIKHKKIFRKPIKNSEIGEYYIYSILQQEYFTVKELKYAIIHSDKKYLKLLNDSHLQRLCNILNNYYEPTRKIKMEKYFELIKEKFKT